MLAAASSLAAASHTLGTLDDAFRVDAHDGRVEVVRVEEFAWGAARVGSGGRSRETAWGAKSGLRSGVLELFKLSFELGLEVVEHDFLLLDPVVAALDTLVEGDLELGNVGRELADLDGRKLLRVVNLVGELLVNLVNLVGGAFLGVVDLVGCVFATDDDLFADFVMASMMRA